MKELVAVVSITFAATAFAADPYLTAKDDTGKTSFTDGARWSDGNPPSPDYDYIVGSGRQIRSPAVNASSFTNAVFAGRSLTLGSSSSGGSLISKTTSNTRGIAQVTIDDLRLINANSYITHGGDRTYSSLCGKITFSVPMAAVTTTSAPYFEMSAKRIFEVYSDLCAEPGYGFKIIRGQSNPSGRVLLMSDNPNFKGYIAVTGEDDYLTAETSGALGPEPAEPTVLLNLRASGAFGVEYGDVTIDQPKRGISVTSAAGGKLYAASGKTLTTSMFITTEATKRPLKKIGAGNVFVTGSCDVGDIEIQEGTLGLAGHVSSDIVVSNNAFFAVASTDSTLTLSGSVTFDGTGAFFFPVDATDGTSGTIELAEGFTSSAWPIPYKTGDMPAAAATQTLFRVASSVRTVRPGDFVCISDAASAEGYATFLTVDTDESGMQTVKRIQSPVIRMKESITDNRDDDSHRMNKADPWENDKVPEAGYAYVVGNSQTLRTSAATTDTVEFPGDSLTFEGTSDFTGPSTFMLKARTTVVSNLVMSGKTVLSVAAASGNGQNQEQVYEGSSLVVASGADSRLIINSSYNRLLTLKAPISGDGTVIICPSSRDANSYMRVGLEGDNSMYFGQIRLSCATDGTSGNYPDIGDEGVTPVTLYLSDGNQLGGNPSAYNSQGVRISSRCCLAATNSLELACPNRAVRVVQNGEINVSEGATMTITSPLILRSGTLVKSGTGTLALGAHVSENDSEGNLIALTAGSIKATTTNGVNGVKVALSSGTSIAVEAGHAAGTPLGDFGYYNVDRDDPFDLTACDGTLAVTVEDVNGTIAAREKTVVNLLTVSSTAADALEGHVTAATAAGKKGVVTRNAADSEGRVTFSAEFSTKGLIISFH